MRNNSVISEMLDPQFKLARVIARLTIGLLLIPLFLAVVGTVDVSRAQGTAQERRVALVIGNGDYRHLPNLANAGRDARDMAAKLTSLGFETLLWENATRRDFFRAVFAFGDKLVDGAVGLVYFAGHGIQSQGRNFLIPVDAELETEADLEVDGFAVDRILGEMDSAGNPLNLLILDACRDNPLQRRRRSALRGLAMPSIQQNARGLVILYAAAPGQSAIDGPKDGNGLFTAAMLRHMDAANTTIEELAKNVTRDVLISSRGKQRPFVNLSLQGNFYFRPGANATTNPSGRTTEYEVAIWSSIEDSSDPADFVSYIKQYPMGAFTSLATKNIKHLSSAQTITPRSAAPDAGSGESPKPMYVERPVIYVRAGPGPNHANIGRLKGGEEVAVIGEIEDKNWVRVSLALGQTGFVFKNLLSDQSPKAQPAVGMFPDAKKQGERFKDCADCPEMVVVPAGSFHMGDLNKSGGRREKPVHRVAFSNPFAVGAFEVTFDEWAACVRSGGCNGYEPADRGWGRGRRPAINVGWHDAKAYVNWLSSKTGEQYRLLSESEWEYVARAGTETKYWWGNKFDSAKANNDSMNVPVGGYSPNGFGLHDIHGNVWEWVGDCWNDSYTGAPTNGSVNSIGDCSFHVIRGGSWNHLPFYLRSAYRFPLRSETRYYAIGFRVARDL